MKKTIIVTMTTLSLGLATGCSNGDNKTTTASATQQKQQQISASELKSFTYNGKEVSAKELEAFAKDFLSEKKNLTPDSIVKQYILINELMEYHEETMDEFLADYAKSEKEAKEENLGIYPKGEFFKTTILNWIVLQEIPKEKMDVLYDGLSDKLKKEISKDNFSFNTKLILEEAAKSKVFDIYEFQKKMLKDAGVKGYTELKKDEAFL